MTVGEIRLQLELWDNRFPLEPPSNRHAEILYDAVREKAKIFEDNAVEHVRTLLSQLDTYESEIKEFTDKHFHGGSKANRTDYVALGIPTADIYKLWSCLK